MATRRLLNSGLGPHRPRTYRKPTPQGATLVEPSGQASTGTNPQPAPTGDAGETPAPPAAPAPAPAPVQVPDDITKVDDLKDWVGNDPVKAQAVINRENAGSYQRKTLLAHMADIVVSA